ncbi:MAG: hypothetical protein PF450_00410 [Bacteroidales bacterium]|jgi:hypothetical protein|nr:hypothetical protein [Bacteroidales bacterium]
MGIRKQKIKIDYSLETLIRAVYSIQVDNKLKFQTGYVKYMNKQVPVWRPIVPNCTDWEATWRKDKWRNIYSIHMHHKPDSKYIECNLVDYTQDEVSVLLPEVSTILTYAFREYIKTQTSSHEE